MKAVLVNGTVVLEDDAIKVDVFPGQPIRFEPETRPRFEAVSVEAWEGTYMTPTPHLEKSEFALPDGR